MFPTIANARRWFDATPMGFGLLVGALCAGCGPEDDAPPGSTQAALIEAARDATSAWAPALPATFSSVTSTATITAQKCTFTIGTAVETGTLPPVYHPWLGRQGCGDDGYLVLGRSYLAPSTLVAGNAQGLIGVFSFTETPSDAAYRKAQVIDVDGESGEVEHSSTLAALPASGTGVVDPETLLLRHDGTVIVAGQKVGVIPGEVGEGSTFVATWPRLVRDAVFNPPPATVEAFP
jgi:hypothetical protein